MKREKRQRRKEKRQKLNLVAKGPHEKTDSQRKRFLSFSQYMLEIKSVGILKLNFKIQKLEVVLSAGNEVPKPLLKVKEEREKESKEEKTNEKVIQKRGEKQKLFYPLEVILLKVTEEEQMKEKKETKKKKKEKKKSKTEFSSFLVTFPSI